MPARPRPRRLLESAGGLGALLRYGWPALQADAADGLEHMKVELTRLRGNS